MRLASIPWSRVALVPVAGALLFVVVRTATAGPQTAPDANDAAHAQRVLGAASAGPARVSGNGIVEPAGRESKLASSVPGVVDKILVREGETVAAGAVLVELESSQQRAALLATEAEVASAQAELTRSMNGLRAEEVDAAVAEAEAAQSRAELARSTLERSETLAKTGAVSADELDHARQQAKDADALSRASTARRRAAVAGTRAEDIALARTRLASAKARREEARARLDQMTLRAPVAGEVLQVKVRVGEYYTPGSGALVVVGDTKKLQVRVDVDERDIGSIALGERAVVQADAFRSRTYTGKVVEIGRRMGRKNVRSDDPVERIDTKILEVVVELDASEGLVPGLRVFSTLEGARK